MELSNFINLNANDTLSSFDKNDLIQFQALLKKYKIEYRELLDINKKSKFGVEIEFSHMLYTPILDFIEKINDKRFRKGKWDIKGENTVRDGTEITSPIMTNKKEDWAELKEVCCMLKKNFAKTNSETGGHVHIDNGILQNKYENWLNFIKLYVAYEHILFRFGYGEYSCERKGLYFYANPCKEQLSNLIMDLQEKKGRVCDINNTKYLHWKAAGICFREKALNTVEYRFPNGTINHIIWQNNINCFVHFMEYASSKNFDQDYINYKNKALPISFYDYNNIDIKNALELADLIFNNNLDKVNFLRQYVKDYNIKPAFAKVKSFTK